MSEGPEQRSWLGAKAPLAINALSVEISDKILFWKIFYFLDYGDCKNKDPAAAWPGDPAGNKGPHGKGTPQRLPLYMGVSGEATARANYGDE